jgi:hypothetical protein
MLQTFQNVLFRLLLDSQLREQFCVAPERVLAPFRLSADEDAALRALTPQTLERCARGLMHQRWSQVQQVMPLSRRLCPSLSHRYLQWLATHPASVEQTVLAPGAAEALRALPALHKSLAQDKAEAVYAADFLAFEVLQCCTRQDGQLRWLQSQFALHLLAQEMVHGIIPLDPERMPSRYRFDRRGTQWQTQTATPTVG